MAIVSRFSVEQAVSVKKAVKRGLTQRLRQSVGIGDSDSSSSSSSDSESDNESGKHSPVFRRKRFSRKATKESVASNNSGTLRGDSRSHREADVTSTSSDDGRSRRIRFSVHGRKKKNRMPDLEMGSADHEQEEGQKIKEPKGRMANLSLPRASFGRWEQSMPADAVLTKEGAEQVSFHNLLSPSSASLRRHQFLQTVDPAIMPLGIITLEDVLEGTPLYGVTSFFSDMSLANQS